MPPAEALLAHDHRELDALAQAAFTAFAQPDAAAAHTALDRLWMRLAVHIRAEHKVLFPALTSSLPDLQTLIQDLRVDHDVFMAMLARLLQDLRKPAPNLPALTATFTEMHDRLQAHNRHEEAEVYHHAGDDPGLTARLKAELAFLPERYGN